MREKKKIISLILIGLIIVVSIGILTKSSTGPILFDKIIMDYIHDYISPIGVSIMNFISLLGSPIFFLTVGLAIFIYFLRSKKRENTIFISLSIVGSYLINATFKNIFSRTRPLNYMLIEHGGYSFPSGHSMVSMSFYTALTYILLKNVKDKKTRTLMWIGNFVLIGLIGFSRLYLGVHWPTDVLVGFTLGFIFFAITKNIVNE